MLFCFGCGTSVALTLLGYVCKEFTMPNEYKPLSKNEKEKIIARHKELVKELNTFLVDPNDPYEVVENEELGELLDSPEYIASYRIADEMKAMKEKQNHILSEYSSNRPLHNPNDFKWLVCAVKSEDTPYAKEYNKKLFSDYENNPELLKARLFKKAMTFDPKKIMECKDDKHKLLEFYKENHEIVDLSEVLASSTGAPYYEGQNKEFLKALEEMSEPLSVLAYPAKLAVAATTDDFYAMPNVSNYHAGKIVINADEKNVEFPPFVRDTLEAKAGDDLSATPEAYFKAISHQRPMTFDSDFLSTYEAVEQKGDNTEIADFSEMGKNPNVKIYEKYEVESLRVKFINKEYMGVYLTKWKENFNNKNNFKEGTDIQEVVNKHKGNMFERAFNTTSKEYKAFEEALKDFHDPNSRNYLNTTLLRNRSNAYKTDNGRIDVSQLSGTAKKRMELVDNTLKALDSLDDIERETDKELLKGYPVEKKVFLSEHDISEQELNKEDKNIGLEKTIEIESNAINV